MLSHLSIRHYVLIDFLEIDFSEGLNIITGETGSGKSIILGALNLILGERAEKRFVREGEKKCTVEGTFVLDENRWKPFFEANDLDFEVNSLFRREVLASGKSRAFINDTPVNVKLMRNIGLALVDVHSQHQTLRLSDPRFQLDVLDAFAETERELSAYEGVYHTYRNLSRQLNRVEEELAAARREMDFIKFQLDELEALHPDEIDEVQMEEEFNVLSNGEEILQKLQGLEQLLNTGETGILASLSEARNLLTDLRDYSDAYRQLHARLDSVVIELDDIASDAVRMAEAVEMDPSRLQELQDLRSALFRMEQKHRVSGIEGLKRVRDELKGKVSGTENLEVELDKLTKEWVKVKNDLAKKASALSEKRKNAVPAFTRGIEGLIQSLNMKRGKFELAMKTAQDPTATGIDEVEMRFSANPGRKPQPLIEVASGGELSRLMLAIKRLSAKETQAVVFDEIDSGVSGEVAHAMGKIMKEMSEQRQIISITHLPQIASKGGAHYKVYKVERGGEVLSLIERLSDEDRVEEIAQMLSGSEMTKAAMDNARDLLHSN